MSAEIPHEDLKKKWYVHALGTVSIHSGGESISGACLDTGDCEVYVVCIKLFPEFLNIALSRPGREIFEEGQDISVELS